MLEHEQEFTWERGQKGHFGQRKQQEPSPCCGFMEPRNMEGRRGEQWMSEWRGR